MIATPLYSKDSSIPKSKLRESSTEKSRVEFGWDHVPNAKYYEIEFIDSFGKIKKIQSRENFTNVKFRCGKYKFRARTVNNRNVKGTWGEHKILDVPFQKPKKLSPEKDEVVGVDDRQNEPVLFKWEDLGPGVQYSLRIEREGGSRPYYYKTTKNEAEVNLKVGESYFWNVNSLKEGCPLDSLNSRGIKFTLRRRLDQPVISRKEFKLRWSKPENAESFDYLIERKDKDEWKYMISSEDVKEQSFTLSRNIPVGNYRITVIAKAKDFGNSLPAVYLFDQFHPSFAQTRVELMASYLLMYKQLSSEGRGLNAFYSGFSITNYAFGVTGVYKGFGAFANYVHSDKKLTFENQITNRKVVFNLQSTRITYGFIYEYYLKPYVFSSKVYGVSETLTNFVPVGAILTEQKDKTSLLGFEIGPKAYLWGFQFYLFMGSDFLLSSSPFKFTPYLQYRLGIEGEKYLSNTTSIGLYFHYSKIEYTFEDESNTVFQNALDSRNTGVFVKWTF